MEGFMLVPPERGSIIGRQLWKPRYIVLGSAALKETPPENILPRSHPSGRVANARRGLKASSSKTALGDGSDTNSKPAPPGVYLSIYKAKGDWEFISQHPVSSFETCDIQAVEHRKQAPSLPTLVINLKPDEEMEKARKRRSSRTGGLTSKDPWANTLLFRTVLEERYNIYDWQVTIKPLVKPSTPPEVLSPISPAFSSFSNPFATRVGETTSRERERPGTSSSQGAEYLLRGVSIQTTTTTTYSHRSDRPSAMISPSPSLRSRRSDLSSQASSQQPMGFTSAHAQHYTTALPSDLPSPASTSGYETQLIEGWTSAQGRSSALSSHTRGSNSMSIVSAVAPLPIGAVSSTPPGPRETILDRAFKNRVIPGSDKVQDTEDDKISSIARFEALMREVDEKKEQKMGSSRLDNSRNIQGWELDEESKESDYEEFAGEEEDEAEELEMDDEDVSIPTPAQRALDYISGRRTPHPPATSHGRPMSPTSPPIPFLNQQAMSAFHGHADAAGGLRPRTGTSSRPTSLALPTRASSSAAVPTLRDPKIPTSEELEQRRSSTSQKRLSFQEFARRLSSTSSLLLVQTNASSSSGSQQSKRGSSDLSLADEEQLANKGGLRNSVVLRGGAGTSSTVSKEERDKRCGWRGSVGVFGNEGGFL